MQAAFVFVALTFFAHSVRADDSTNGQGGVGVAAYATESTSDGTSQRQGGLLLGYSGETLILSQVGINQKHFAVLDARGLLLVGGGANWGENQGLGATFRAKVMGNVSGGIQMYRLFPLNLSVEDIDYDARGGDYEAKELIGATLYVPISLLTNMKDRGLYLGETIGFRKNNHIATGAAGQTKLRYLDERFSAELRYLRNVQNSEAVENRVVFEGSLRDLALKGDQLGVVIEYDSRKFKDPSQDSKNYRSFDGMLLYSGFFQGF